MTSGIVRRLYVLYWASAERSDWKNARTDDLIYELTYNDKLRLPLRDDLDWVMVNCNRRTESYVAHRELVERFRSKKMRYYPLIYVDLWEKGVDGTREEFWVIDSDYWMKKYLERLHQYFSTPNK